MGESQAPPETPAPKPEHPVALNAPADLSNSENIPQTFPISRPVHNLDFTAGYGSDNSAPSPLASTRAGNGVYKPLPRIPRARTSSAPSQPIIPSIQPNNIPQPYTVPHDPVRDNCIQDAGATSSHQPQNSSSKPTRNTNQASVHSDKNKEKNISPFQSIGPILGNLNEQNVDVLLRTDRGDSNEKIHTARVRSTSDPRPIRNSTELRPPSFLVDPPSHWAGAGDLPIHPFIPYNPEAHAEDNLYDYTNESPSFVRPSFPDPDWFEGEDDDDTDFLMFCEQLRAKITLDKHLFRDEKSKVLFAIKFLGRNLRRLVAEKWDKDTCNFKDITNHEDVIRIIREHREKPQETYRRLLESKKEIEGMLRVFKKKISGPDIAHGVATHGWNQFKERFDDEPISAIEALIGKPKYYWQRNHEDESTPLITKNSNGSTERDYDLWREKWREGRDIPERIRINSSPLVQVLRKVAGEYWGGIDFEASEDEVGTSLVFLRPYKFFYHFHAEIASREEVLKERLSSVQSSPTHRSENNAVVETTPEESSSDASKDTDEEAQALEHLRNLIKFIDSAVLPTAEKLRLSVDDHRAPSRVCFQDLWYLFQPGDDVYISEEMPEQTQQKDLKKSSVRNSVLNKPSAWRVYNVSGGRPLLSQPDNGQQPRSSKALFLVLYKIDYNGILSMFGPTSRIIDIPHFEGEKDITALNAVPLRFSRDSSEKEVFQNLGQRFLQLTKQKYVHQQYTGPTLTRSPVGIEYVGAENANLIHERVMVDFQDAAAENPDWVPDMYVPEVILPGQAALFESWPVKTWTKDDKNWTSKARSDNIYDDSHVDWSRTQKYKEDNKLFNRFLKWSEWSVTENRVTHDHISEDDILLLPNRVCAFRFSRKEYINITVEGLNDFPEPSDGWDEIVFDNPGQRKILEGLVKSHRARKGSRLDSSGISHPKLGQDLVAGKGEGLVILLHGKPGVSVASYRFTKAKDNKVGKTSTVECLSESLQIPLLPISCGTLGMQPAEIEYTLRRLFRKSERWNGLILFDEADVVLVERDRNKMIQNEICSSEFILVVVLALKNNSSQSSFASSSIVRALYS